LLFCLLLFILVVIIIIYIFYLLLLLLVRLLHACVCDTLAYQKALSLADDTQWPLVHVALAMCSYADGDVDDAKTYLLPL